MNRKRMMTYRLIAQDRAVRVLCGLAVTSLLPDEDINAVLVQPGENSQLC